MHGVRLRPQGGDVVCNLKAKQEEILEVCAKRGAHNVRVFGSVARRKADEPSASDFLAEIEPDRALLDLGGLQ